MTRVYSSKEVSRHDQANDLWITIHGGVYDLTKFLKEHPGGEEVLLKLAGQDGTVCFDQNDHSAEAVKLRETFKIGQSGAEQTSDRLGLENSADEIQNVQDDEEWEYEEVKKETSSWYPYFFGIGVLVYAIIFYYLL